MNLDFVEGISLDEAFKESQSLGSNSIEEVITQMKNFKGRMIDTIILRTLSHLLKADPKVILLSPDLLIYLFTVTMFSGFQAGRVYEQSAAAKELKDKMEAEF